MAVGIGVNVILGQTVASALKIPIYLDSIGTILVGVLCGPIAGALTGGLGNILWSYVIPPPFQYQPAAAFAIVAVAIGVSPACWDAPDSCARGRTAHRASSSPAAPSRSSWCGVLTWAASLAYTKIFQTRSTCSPTRPRPT